MTTQDADLIRELRDWSESVGGPFNPGLTNLLRNAAARIAELTQPAPLALSPEDAMVWNARVQAAQVTTAKSCIDDAIIAVDAMLKQRADLVSQIRREMLDDLSRGYS